MLTAAISIASGLIGNPADGIDGEDPSRTDFGTGSASGAETLVDLNYSVHCHTLSYPVTVNINVR